MDLHFLQIALLQLGLKTKWSIAEFEYGLANLLGGKITTRIAVDCIVGSGSGTHPKQQYWQKAANEGKLAERACKYGAHCTRQGCWFSHPGVGNSSPKQQRADPQQSNYSKSQLHQRLETAGYTLRLSENKRSCHSGKTGHEFHTQKQQQGAVDVEVALAIVELAGGFAADAPGHHVAAIVSCSI